MVRSRQSSAAAPARRRYACGRPRVRVRVCAMCVCTRHTARAPTVGSIAKKLFLIGDFVRNLRGPIVVSRDRPLLRKQKPPMGKILLCDDEDTLLRSLGRILRAVGHEVVAT